MRMVALKLLGEAKIRDFGSDTGDQGLFGFSYPKWDAPTPTHVAALPRGVKVRDQDGASWFADFAVTPSEAGPVKALTLWTGNSVHAFWLLNTAVYQTSDRDLTSEDVRALINVQSNRRRLQLEKAHALQAMVEQLEPKVRRERIPQDVKVFIWQRDKGRCVECDGNSNLEFDHVIPLALGGSNTARNLQLLCETCNRRKGASLG